MISTAATEPTTIVVKIDGDHTMGEYIITSPSHPLYHYATSTHPFDMCNAQRADIRDATRWMLDPSDHLQPIWDALLASGHFITGQFGHEGVVTLWASGGTAPCDVETTLRAV